MSVQSTRSLVHSESGIALLGTVLVAALVLGLAAWGVLNITSNAQQSVYRENAANQARTAALMGIQAVTGYAQSIYVGSTPPTSASLSNLVTAPLTSPNGIIDQSFTQPTNANVQAMIVANTFSVTASTGYIKMLSTGRSGSAIQTAEAYLTAQLNNLNNYNNANLILGPGSTFNGKLKGGIPVVASTASTAASSGITLNGTKEYQYIPISYFPVINPLGFEKYSTIELGAGTITIPASAVSFYTAPTYSTTSVAHTELFATAPTSSGSSFACSVTATASSTSNPPSCSSYQSSPSSPGLAGLSTLTTEGNSGNVTSTCSYLFCYTAAAQSSTPGTWTVNSPVNAFIYSDQNINVAFTSAINAASQLTVATSGTISSSGEVTLFPFATENTTYTATTSSTPYSLVNFCTHDPQLSICNSTGNPYQNLQGLVYVATGNISTQGGQGSSFYGDVTTSGSLMLNGGGSYSFGGTIIAENGIAATKGNSKNDSSTVNGAITLTAPVAAANSATLGGYQLTPSSIRWVP
jgi:hypothetical protein